ncbi:MAG: substrate-binding domain-containing protein [Casimicrobiaceae bacterium]
MTLAVLCAGAAKGLVAALESAFEAETGETIDGTFGAVGALREKLLAGEPCDVIVLTAPLVDTLKKDGRVVPGSAAPLGTVRTGIAARAGEPLPDIHDAAALRATLLGASRLLFPDPQRATAGIHFVGVLRRLGVHDDVAPRCATFPNGATAMRALAEMREHGAVGCTQVTEINYTPGVALAGALPPGFDLATVYTAAVCTGARDRVVAQRFVHLLGGAESRALRARGGFEL